MKEVYIIGGGYSLKRFDFSSLKDKDTICVNKSVFSVPNPNYFVTVDFSVLKKLEKTGKKIPSTCSKIFVANLDLPYIKEKEGRIIDIRYDLIYDLNRFDVVIKSKKTESLGFDFHDFRNGWNSGFCALQLAVILRYDKIYLLGIDLNIVEETHFHMGYGQDKESFQKMLDIYYGYFKKGLEKLKDNPWVQVYNCSETSRLKEILPYYEL